MASDTITGIAESSADFELLAQALAAFGLDAVLDDPAGDFTVFAPTDAAFVQLAQDLGFAGTDEAGALGFLLANVDAAVLEQVLLYHVSAGAKDAAAVSALASIDTLAGEAITIDLPVLQDLEPDLADPSLIATDMAATNGIVHVIDRVLLPVDLPGNDAPSIAGIVAQSGEGFDTDAGDFDMLLAAVKAAGLVGALDDPGADLTVFAPTDGAFVALAGDLGYGGSDEAGALSYILTVLGALNGGDAVGLLTDVLLYHVSAGAQQQSQVVAQGEVTTLLGASFGVDAGTGTLIDNEPDLADPGLVATDIQASNGIVHVIDGVLIPADLPGEIDVDGQRFLFAGEGGLPLRGGQDGDVLVGTTGGDKLLGLRGDQVVFAGDGDDLVIGGRGDDVLWGGEGDDRLHGNQGNDVLSGGAGDDVLRGFGGRDVIEGGAGNDLLSGGVGGDRFVFGDGFGHDVIEDFRPQGGDVLDFSGHGGVDGIGDLTITHAHGATVISDGFGNSITLAGRPMLELGEDAFVF